MGRRHVIRKIFPVVLALALSGITATACNGDSPTAPTLTTARNAQGTMFTPSLGNQMFPFTMTR